MPPPLLLLLAAFLLPPPSAATAQQPSCWPKTCKGLNITYPFWVEERGRPPCGPPAFQIKCNSTGAFLSRSVYQAYQVVSIFPNNQSLHVVNHNLPLDTGCPAPTFNVSLFGGLILFSKANKELLFLGKCTGLQPAVSTGFRSLSCDRSSFVRLGDGRNFSSQSIQLGGIPPGCLFTVVPTLGLGAPDGNGDDDYIAGMRNGFLLEWGEVPGHCPECMASDGVCTYSGDAGLKFACNCSGSLRPEKCGAGELWKQKFTPISLLFFCCFFLKKSVSLLTCKYRSKIGLRQIQRDGQNTRKKVLTNKDNF
jgi:hypothetical protein